MKANLIVSHEPSYYNYRWALDQLKDLLGNVKVVDVAPSRILLRVNDPYEAIDIIREYLPEDTPILRVIPIDEIVEPYVESVAEYVWSVYENRIPENATYRITLEGRHLYWRNDSRLAHTRDAIRYIASKVNRRVDLENYSWIIYVRIMKTKSLGEIAATTITSAKYIFSKSKR